MKYLIRLPFILAVLLSQIAYAQDKTLPITSRSDAAVIDFLAGRNAAFYYDQMTALNFLDDALLKDSTFVLAHLHRAGMSNRNSREREKHFIMANRHSAIATEGEQKLIKAFEAFLREGHKDIPLAIELLSELHTKYPDDYYLPTYIGLRYLFNLNQYAEARNYFQRALSINPRFSQALQWIGLSYQYEKEYDTAEEYFSKSINLAPEEAFPLYLLGELYFEIDSFDLALTSFLQALQRNPYEIYIKEGLTKVQNAIK